MSRIAKKTLENIEDDLQIKIDEMFDRLTLAVKREATALKEERLRDVCVDYPHVEASVIQGIYDRLVEASFEDENLLFYFSSWKNYFIR